MQMMPHQRGENLLFSLSLCVLCGSVVNPLFPLRASRCTQHCAFAVRLFILLIAHCSLLIAIFKGDNPTCAS
jgi:hypothetical protein